MESPTPTEIKAARKESGLSQAKAAELIYFKTRAWVYWEAGQREMHPSAFDLFKIKVNQQLIL